MTRFYLNYYGKYVLFYLNYPENKLNLRIKIEAWHGKKGCNGFWAFGFWKPDIFRCNCTLTRHIPLQLHSNRVRFNFFFGGDSVGLFCILYCTVEFKFVRYDHYHHKIIIVQMMVIWQYCNDADDDNLTILLWCRWWYSTIL